MDKGRDACKDMMAFCSIHVSPFHPPCPSSDVCPRQVGTHAVLRAGGKGLTDGLRSGLQSFVNLSLCLPTRQLREEEKAGAEHTLNGNSAC